MTHDQELAGYILEGMARAIWVQAFIHWASEVDPPPVLRGDTWDEAAPNTSSTRAASMKAAKALADLIKQSNPGHANTLVESFHRVKRKFGPGGTEADRAYAFGKEIALMAIGVLTVDGTGLTMPTFQVSLDDDGRALSWDGGMSWHQNPPRKPSRTAAPRGIPLSEGDANKLRVLRGQAYTIMSDEAARRLVERIDRALQTGTLDSETQLTLESFGEIEEWNLDQDLGESALDAFHGGWKANPQWPSSQVQSLLFNRHRYSVSQAKRWAEDHGFKYGSVDTTENYHRIRQFAPEYGRPCRTIDFGHDIRAIVCATSNPGKPFGIEVLVMEDDPKLQVGIARMVKAILTNPHIIFADNVGAAIADLEVHQFGLVISDVNVLGSRTGIDLFRHVQELYPGLVDRFVFFTDDASAQRMHYRYLEKGAATAENLRGVINAPAPGHPAVQVPTEISLVEFANAVLQAASRIQTSHGHKGMPKGRFGRNKVFIAAIWRDVHSKFPGMTRAEFDQQLLAANRRRLLVLARADLVGAMDDAEVADSEISDRGANFHFVLDPTAKEAWE